MKDDGGPAFPINYKVRELGAPTGMSLRDKFADSAISLFSLTEKQIDDLITGTRCEPMHATVAEFCWDLADAMLEGRKKT